MMTTMNFKYKFPAVNQKSDTIYEIQKPDSLEVRGGRHHQFRGFQAQREQADFKIAQTPKERLEIISSNYLLRQKSKGGSKRVFKRYSEIKWYD